MADLKLGMYRIHHMESMEFMLQMEKESVDCVITDPPYFGFGFEMDAENYIEKFYRYVVAMLRVCKGEVKEKRISISQPKSKMELLLNKIDATQTLLISDAFADKRGEDALFMLRNPIDTTQVGYESWTELPESAHPNNRDINKMAALIKAMSKPGETVFDPFCGSAAIGIAAVLLGRNFIGCELMEERVQDARQGFSSIGAVEMD